jgi:hypothetical protein
MMFSLRFIFIFLISFLFIRCNDDSKKVIKNTPTVESDGLIFIKDTIKNTLFFISGKETKDITKIQVVGVQHTPSHEIAGIHLDTKNSYEMFWATYLHESKRNPKDVKLSLEMGVEASPNSKIGNLYELEKPISLITDWMFEIGLRKVRIADPRIKNQKLFDQHEKALNFFLKKGGEAKIEKIENGFPVIIITKEPIFNQRDLNWLKNEWYPECFLADKEFEKILWKNCLKGDIAVVGAAHAFRLHKEYGAQIALTINKKTLFETAYSMAFNDYYLKVIEQ